MNDFPRTDQFVSATIILPVMNETVSLTETVDTILKNTPRPLLLEIIIVVCQRTTAASMETIATLQKAHGDLISVLPQSLPFLGGAIRDGFDRAQGSHVVMMASDLETDPKEVPLLIEEARRHPNSVVTTSRWREPGRFHGYSTIKLACNWIFQKFFSILYGTSLTDMTYGYRVLPTKLVQAIRWEELRHPFNLETMVKPLRLGVPVIEISTGWQARKEGESQNSFFQNFAYFRPGLRTRFASPRSLLKSIP